MKSDLIVTLLVTMAALVFSSRAAAADGAQICDSKTEKGYIQIMKGTGENARNPSLEELFDALNKTGSLLGDLKYEENRKNQPLVYIEVPGKPAVYYDFQSVPKKGKGDPRCTDQKVTGYECRLQQLRGDEEIAGLPKGIQTGVQIKVPLSDPELLGRISSAFGCGEVVEASGKPLLTAPAVSAAALKAAKPVPASKPATAAKPASAAKAAKPAGDGPATLKGATVKPKVPSNVIPAIQLRSVPSETKQ